MTTATAALLAAAVIGVRAPNALQRQLDAIRRDVATVKTECATNAANIVKVSPRGTAYSTLALKRELAAIEKWTAAKALLETHDAWDEYILASWLEADDPVFQAACALLVSEGIVTQAQLDDILPRCVWTEY